MIAAIIFAEPTKSPDLIITMVIFISMITNEIWWEGPGCQPCLAPPPFPEESSSWVEDAEYDEDAEHVVGGW